MKKIFIIISFLFSALTVYAQSAEVVTDILDSEKVTIGQVCYLSAVSQGLADENASFEDAVLALAGQGQLSEIADASKPATAAQVSAVYAKMFGIKGGLFYMITGGSPRYAFKHFKSQGLIPQNTDPSKILSGRDALSLFTKINMRYGEAQFTEEL